MQTYKNFIDGKFLASRSGDVSEVENPATEEIIAKVPKSNNADVDDAVAAAKAAFPAWNTTPVEERKEYMKKILQGLKDREDEIAETIVKELGASHKFSTGQQVPLPIKEIEGTIEALDQIEFDEKIDETVVQKEGFGVVACITPWNYPLLQIERKITPAILTGNTVVVNPASNTPLTALIYAEIIEASGLPKGVFNLVMGPGSSTGDYLSGHEDVSVVSFTGSTAVGSGMYEKAGPTIKKLILELGGKSVMLALPGADKEAAVKQSANTVINNQGQTCTALTRLVVPRAELEDYKQVLKDFYAENAIVGDPQDPETTVGPMVSKDQQETVLDYIQKGKDEGAEVLIGGNKLDRTGYYVEPTVFVNVSNDMTIAQEEIFGPVLAVIAYDTVEEAVEISNDIDYGLFGAVQGPDKEEAYRIARLIRTGGIVVNNGPRNPKAPFGGYKKSGLGRENGYYGLEDYLEIKSIFV